MAPGSEPTPWNLVYHSLFKVDTQNIGILWYDAVEYGSEEDAEGAAEATSSPMRVLRTSIYNMFRNSWRSIRLVSPGLIPNSLPAFRFGTAVVPVFDKNVAIRE